MTDPKSHTHRLVTMTADDGTEIDVGVPWAVPTQDRAEELRKLYKEHVHHPGGHWKGRAEANVPAELADSVAEAMDFMGSLVDERYETDGGTVVLKSEGYWAHGF